MISFKKRSSVYIKIVIISFFLGSLDITQILSISSNLAMCFVMDTDHVLLKLCNNIGNFGIIYKAAKYLYENESKSKHLCLIAVLLLKYLAAKNLPAQCESFNTSSDGLLNSLIVEDIKNDEDKSDTDMYLEGLTFCQKIMRKALLTAGPEDMFAICEVINWVNTCFYLTKRGNQIELDIYKTIYTPEFCVPSFKAFSTIKELFDTCATFSGE